MASAQDHRTGWLKFPLFFRTQFVLAMRQIFGLLKVREIFGFAGSIVSDRATDRSTNRGNYPTQTTSQDMVFSNLALAGADIRPVEKALVWPDTGRLTPRRMPSRTDGQEVRRFEKIWAPKTGELVKYLLDIGVQPNEFRITPGDIDHRMLRDGPYSLIEIPSRNIQIAVCDLIGHTTFISSTLLPLSMWSDPAQTKKKIRVIPGVYEFRYDKRGTWLSEIGHIVLNGSPQIKTKKPPRPPLTEELIVEWIKLYKEYTGIYPVSKSDDTSSDPVWINNIATNKWEALDENWHAIDGALRDGDRTLPGGSSLYQLRKAHGLIEKPDLTVKKIKRWIRLYNEYYEGKKWPSSKSPIIWDKDAEGKWIKVESENWRAIETALIRGRRGLPEGLSIAQLKKEVQEEMNISEWSREKIIRWIGIFISLNGRWPIQQDSEVLDYGKKGEYVKTGKKWPAVNRALIEGRPDMPGGSSLILLKEELAANPDLFPEDVRPDYIPPLPPPLFGRAARQAAETAPVRPPARKGKTAPAACAKKFL
jgi:hypothetical protein